MRFLYKTLFLSLFIFLSVASVAKAKEYTFSDAPANLTYKISTTQTKATITISSTMNASQRFAVSVWKTDERGTSSNKIVEHEVSFSGTPPRTTSFTVTGLTIETKYYLFDRAEGTNGAKFYEFSTENTPVIPCASCKFTATLSGNTAIATLSGVDAANIPNMKITVLTSPFNPGISLCSGGNINPMCLSLSQIPKTVTSGVITWTLPPTIFAQLFAGKTDYYFRAEGKVPGGVYLSNEVKLITLADIINSQWPLTYKPSGDSAWISGQINNANPIDFSKTELQYSRLPFDNATSEALPAEATPVPAQRDEGANSTLGIAGDGKYGFKLTGLSPNTVYYVKQIIKSENNKRGAPEIKVDKFNSTIGYVPENSVDAKADYEKRSYKLLAPLPGLQVIFDQDLCREYVAEGKPVPGGDCDNQISNFINLLIKILIGLAAIVLVVQLIIQGYVYMVTDVPFLKAGAKSRFFDALFGLLLAMASYLILNTINPKLVSSTLSVDNIDIGVTALSDAHEYRLTQTQNTPGAHKFTRTQYYELIKTVSAKPEYSIPPCLLQVAVQREASGGGKPHIIGHDEDVAELGIGSRRVFLTSGKKFDNSTFSPMSAPGVASFKNTDHPSDYHAAPNPNAPDLGLDWRFTHSVGMFGVTFGPGNQDPSGAKALYQDINVDFSFAAKLMAFRYKQCKGNIEQTWRAYAGGQCDSGLKPKSKPTDFVNKETPIRVDLYNQCVAQQ